MIKLLLFLLLLSSTAFGEGYSTNAEAEEDAKQAIGEAFYKQSGIEANVSNLIKNTIPKEYEGTIANVTLVVNTIVTKKVEVRWEFP